MKASTLFVALVNERTVKVGDYNTAWRQIRAERPDLYNKMSGDDGEVSDGRLALANASSAETASQRYGELVAASTSSEVNRRFADLKILAIARGRPPVVALENSHLSAREDAQKTAQAASDKFADLVRELEQKRKLQFSAAWHEAARQRPDLVEAMNADSGAQVRARAAGRLPQGHHSESLANSAAMAAAVAATPPPVSGPGAALFGLWPGVDQDVFAAAFRANGNRMPPPLDAAKVFEAIANYIAKRDGIPLEEAITVAKKNADGLWKLVEAAAR